MIEEVLKKYSKDSSNLIEILNVIQDNEGYISLDNQLLVAEYLEIELAEVYSVITFYSRFTTTPSGKYNISICMGTACYVKGAASLLLKLESLLGISVGEVSKDGLFKIVENRCVGACSLAPVLIINEKIHGNCTDEMLEKLINDIRGGTYE